MGWPTCKRNSGKTVNKILVYPGSFDPPHRGRLELLTHVFHHRDDIIAVIVIPLDDDDIRTKCRATGDKLLFTKQERVKIWRGHGPSDWLWVFDRSATDWSPFRRNLIKATAEDGFRLDFVLLAGPDQINPKFDVR
ncbi:uncharacterized protein G6M90_00g064370 [Metarhizium brunneum]|uniref:Cytidyltransferase-like domain-containing protein n=1 Tax=Metarhizium brunneum TaxID=500148 RepID=A0A7D5YUT7_9HYPO